MKCPKYLAISPKTDLKTYFHVRKQCCYWYIVVWVASYIYTLCTDDTSRVILAAIPGKEGSDYMNASYIDVSTECLQQIDFFFLFLQGYNKPDGFIAAQGLLL